jgi:hypothetical protein
MLTKEIYGSWSLLISYKAKNEEINKHQLILFNDNHIIFKCRINNNNNNNNYYLKLYTKWKCIKMYIIIMKWKIIIIIIKYFIIIYLWNVMYF